MKIGPYELISELGRGGMAQLWLAHKVWEDGERRPCVIKLPRRNAVTDEGILRQLVEEARISLQLRHNNIVSVFDVGFHEGLPYLVMNYVAGKDLAQILRATSRLDMEWDIETALHVVREVAQGLLWAHELEQQIIHRDIASKNVMIDGAGGVLLMDFGVATSLSTLTSRIHVKGTLSYMAPEHYLGQASRASDVFGLGAICWEMLAGRRFRGDLPEGPELIAAVVEGAVDPVGRELPASVERLLMGMLNPDASSRTTLAEVLLAVEDYPNRSRTLKEMLSLLFGRAGKRTGLSQVHFAASKELVDTFAVAKAAGVSVSPVRNRKRPGQPDDVPIDFEALEIPKTSRVDPLAIVEALDDDLDEDERGSTVAKDDEEEKTSQWTPGPGDDEPNLSVVTARVPASDGLRLVIEPETQRSTETEQAEAEQDRETEQAKQAKTVPPNAWPASGDTLRSPESEDHAHPPEPTTRLPMEVVVAPVPPRDPDAPERPTERLSPPISVAMVSSASSSGPAAPLSPTPVGPQPNSPSSAPTLTSAVEQESRPGLVARRPLDGTTEDPDHPRWSPGLMVLTIVVMVTLGAGAWSAWPRTEAQAHSELDRAPNPSVVVVGTPEAPPVAVDVPVEPDGELIAASVVDPADTTTGATQEIEPMDPSETMTASTGALVHTGPPTDSTDELPSYATTSELDTEDKREQEQLPSPTLLSIPEPIPSEPAPMPGAGDDEPTAKPKPPRPKPAPRLDFIVRRGLAVGFAEVQVGRGKVHTIPARGAATLRVRPGTYKLRYRSTPDGAWGSIRQTFSAGMKYAGHLELNGLRIMAMPKEAG